MNKSTIKKLHNQGDQLQDIVIKQKNLIDETLELCDEYLKTLEKLMEELSNVYTN